MASIDKITHTCGFRFNEKADKVLLIKKYKPDWQKGYLNGIGGGVEEDETIYDCVEREFEEEADLGTYDEWRHFLSMGIDGVDCGIAFFVSFGNDVNGYFGKSFETDEGVVNVYDYPDILHEGPPMMNNLYWLLPMALDDSVIFSDLWMK